MKTLELKLPFTHEQSLAANEEWQATCGAHSIAAAAGCDLDLIRKMLREAPDLNYRGWMSPTMVSTTFERLRRHRYLHNFERRQFKTQFKTKQLCQGVSRIQFEGKWLNPGVPPRVAYFHTHYVARMGDLVFCTGQIVHDWLPIEFWENGRPYDDPWHVTHHWLVERNEEPRKYLIL